MTDSTPFNLTEDCIKSAYSALNSKKEYANENEIPHLVLDNTIAVLAVPLALIFSKILLLGAFPDSFKTATVVPLFKAKGSKYDLLCYRPTFMLATLNKLFEKLIKNRILGSVRMGIGLRGQQHGFAQQLSCFTALLKLTTDVLNYIDIFCGRVLAVFIDLRLLTQ